MEHPSAFLNKAIIFLKKHFFHITMLMVTFGVVSLFLGIFLELQNNKLNDFFKTFGQVVLGAGLFSAILKSFQFSGIFREELSEVIYEQKFLDEKNDIREIWGRATTALCKKKFPEISEELGNAIVNHYLPSEIEYYYSDYSQSGEIKFIDNNKKFVNFIEKIAFTIKTVNPNKSISYKFNSTIRKAAENDRAAIKIETMSINNILLEHQPLTSYRTENKTLRMDFKTDLKGHNEYKIAKTLVKVYDIEYDFSKSFNALRIIKDFELHLRLPEEIEAFFHPTGVLGAYFDKENNTDKTKTTEPHNSLIWMRYSGIIFKKQGYRLIFKKKE